MPIATAIMPQLMCKFSILNYYTINIVAIIRLQAVILYTILCCSGLIFDLQYYAQYYADD